MTHEGLRALNRFGLGARPGESGRIRNPKRWLRAQLDPANARLADDQLPSFQEIGDAIRALRQARRDEEARKKARQMIRRIAVREGAAALRRRIVSETPFVERLTAFWSNHLCVSAQGKLGVVPLAGHYERTVIRPHVLGSFRDMVAASAQHPAMLLYLDNAQSIGPSSRAGRMASRRGRQRGLNENYARELLELHTVGVDGGYTQEDIEQLARIFTGWTIAGVGPRAKNAADPVFAFRNLLHEPGDKTVMGTRYRAEGVAEGEKVIRDICRKPATARFVAQKLARHFVSDDPPANAVARIAEVFQKTDGDLLRVSQTLIDLEEAWSPDHRKFRTPQDWLTAVLRAVGAKEAPPVMGEALRQLRQPLWAPPSPKGYGDSAQDWADPDSLMNRAELARSVSRRLNRSGLDPMRLLDVAELTDGDPLSDLLADDSIPRDERLALAIAGPAFQWR